MNRLNTSIFHYDPIGNLIQDKNEKIDQILWTVTGKVSDVIFTPDTNHLYNLAFRYDPMGNRIAKIQKPHASLANSATWTITWYARDAQGNVMAVYNKPTNSTTFAAGEFNIYGSSRIGMVTQPEALSQKQNDTLRHTQILGLKVYEFSNHLGNVLTTFSDRKIEAESISDQGHVAWYTSEILSSTDYYPFGFQMPGRVYEADGYRYGFNSMEKDDELKGTGNSYDFGARIYDPRVGRWLAVDPLCAMYSSVCSYAFVANIPLALTDPDGQKIRGVKYNAETGEFKYSKSAIKRGTKRYIEARMQTAGGKEDILKLIEHNKKVKVSVTDQVFFEAYIDSDGQTKFAIIKGSTEGDGSEIIVSTANYSYKDLEEHPELLDNVKIIDLEGNTIDWKKLPIEQVANPFEHIDEGSKEYGKLLNAYEISGRKAFEQLHPYSNAFPIETIIAVGAHEETHFWDIVNENEDILKNPELRECRAMIYEVEARKEYWQKVQSDTSNELKPMKGAE